MARKRKNDDDLLGPTKRTRKAKGKAAAAPAGDGGKLGVRPGSRKDKLYKLFDAVGTRKRIESITKQLECTPKALGELVSDLKNPAYSNPVITLKRDGDLYERTA